MIGRRGFVGALLGAAVGLPLAAAGLGDGLRRVQLPSGQWATLKGLDHGLTWEQIVNDDTARAFREIPRRMATHAAATLDHAMLYPGHVNCRCILLPVLGD